MKRVNTIPKDGSAVFWLVTLWFAIEYLRPQDYVSAIGSMRPALVLFLIVAVVWLLRGDKSPLHDNLIRLYVVFLGLGSMSVLYAVNTYWVAQYNMMLFTYLVAGVLPFIAFMNKPEQLKKFFFYWVIFHGLIGLAGVLRGGTGSGSFMGDENDLALTLAMGLPYAYFLAFGMKTTTLRRAICIAAALLMVAGIIASESRGGFLGMAAAAAAVVWFSKNRVRNLVIVALMGGSVALFVSEDYRAEMSSITDARDATRASRVYYWKRATEMFADAPIIGIGTGNYGWRVETYELRDPTFNMQRARSGGRVAHSLYFTVLPEYGLAGTTVFAIMALMVVRRLNRMRRRLGEVEGDEVQTVVALSRAASGALVSFLVAGAFLSVLYYPHFWYLVGFTITLERVATRLAPQLVAERVPRRRAFVGASGT